MLIIAYPITDNNSVSRFPFHINMDTPPSICCPTSKQIHVGQLYSLMHQVYLLHSQIYWNMIVPLQISTVGKQRKTRPPGTWFPPGCWTNSCNSDMSQPCLVEKLYKETDVSYPAVSNIPVTEDVCFLEPIPLKEVAVTSKSVTCTRNTVLPITGPRFGFEHLCSEPMDLEDKGIADCTVQTLLEDTTARLHANQSDCHDTSSLPRSQKHGRNVCRSIFPCSDVQDIQSTTVSKNTDQLPIVHSGYKYYSVLANPVFVQRQIGGELIEQLSTHSIPEDGETLCDFCCEVGAFVFRQGSGLCSHCSTHLLSRSMCTTTSISQDADHSITHLSELEKPTRFWNPTSREQQSSMGNCEICAAEVHCFCQSTQIRICYNCDLHDRVHVPLLDISEDEFNDDESKSDSAETVFSETADYSTIPCRYTNRPMHDVRYGLFCCPLHWPEEFGSISDDKDFLTALKQSAHSSTVTN